MRTLIQNWIHRLLMTFLIAMTGLTTRKTFINRHIIDSYRAEGQGFVAGLWHNNIIYFTYFYGQLRMAALVSQSRDGQNVARVSEFFGVRPIRGSNSKGGLGALRGLYRLVSRGQGAAVTPDGPRGPRYVLQPGIVAVAQRAGVPIVPMTYAGRHMIHIKSWDRMKLALPFSRIAIYFGDPIWIDKDEKDEEAARRRVELALRQAEVIVERFVGGSRVEEEPLLAEAEAALHKTADHPN
ncbi:MAG: lysophospholipid acyltransferase family protein [SAR324 cluster bacterium]|nr:lysophospholipid acyltransferase family protein [SAR324 cluster bacterium]